MAGRMWQWVRLVEPTKPTCLRIWMRTRVCPLRRLKSCVHRSTDLALHTTKQTAAAIHHSMAAMVATERHQWVNLAAIGKKEKDCLLDARLSPTVLFGTSVEAVVDKFREVKAESAAFRRLIPRRSKSSSRGGDLSEAEAHRQDQKSSVANRASL